MIERLESRIAPAGIVKIVTAGGNVTITGDGATNDISIQIPEPGQLLITGNNGTTLTYGDVSGSSAQTVPYAKNLTVAMGIGNDKVSLAAGFYYGNVTLDGGVGNNTFNFGAVSIAGNLSILAKEGFDQVTVTGGNGDFFVGRDLSFKLGEGFNIVQAAGLDQLTVAGKLNILGGRENEIYSFDASSTVISGDATIKTGKGVDQVTIHATESLSFGGKLSITGAELSADQPVMAVVGTNFGITSDDLMSVRGAVSITTVNGQSGLTFGGANQTTLASGLTIKGGKAINTFTIDTDDLRVIGNVAISSAGTTTFNLSPATGFLIAGNLSYKGGALVDNFTLSGTGTVTGKVSIDLGAGADQEISITAPSGGAVSIFGDLSLKQGAKIGFSTTTLARLVVGGKLSIGTGAAADTVIIDNAAITGFTTIALGAGDDILRIETNNLPDATSFDGGLKALLGAGADTATFGTAAAGDLVFFGGVSLVDGGTETDTVTEGVNNVGSPTRKNVE